MRQSEADDRKEDCRMPDGARQVRRGGRTVERRWTSEKYRRRCTDLPAASRCGGALATVPVSVIDQSYRSVRTMSASKRSTRTALIALQKTVNVAFAPFGARIGRFIQNELKLRGARLEKESEVHA